MSGQLAITPYPHGAHDCTGSDAAKLSAILENPVAYDCTMKRFSDPAVAQIFSGYAAPMRSRLLKLRELVFSTAKRTPGVGALEETLKWGQPSYLTTETRSGSTIRLGAVKARPGEYALYFHCQTTLVETFKEKFGSSFRYEGNRALLFSVADKIPETELRECIALALTYYAKNKGHRVPIRLLIR